MVQAGSATPNTTLSSTASNETLITAELEGGESKPLKSHQMTYILVSICSVVLFGIIIVGFVYRKKLKTNLNAMKSKYVALFSTTDRQMDSQLSTFETEK